MILDQIRKISNQKLVIRGLGVEGIAFARWLIEYLKMDPGQIILSDSREAPELDQNPLFKKLILDYKFTLLLGDNFAKYLDNLSDISYVFKSPGIWSLSSEFQRVREVLGVQSVQAILSIFIEKFGSRTIAVTGTKGKTTTCNYLLWILEIIKKNRLFSPVFSYHRIGNTANISPYSIWKKENEDDLIKDLFVLEISSFQLQDLEVIQPNFLASIITNYFIDHQDVHQSPKEYWGSKDVVFKFSSPNNLICTKSVCEHTLARDLIAPDNILNESTIQAIDSRINNPLRGEHNQSNLALAMVVALNCYQVPANQIIDFLDQNQAFFNQDHQSFKHSPHRLELIDRIRIKEHLIDCFDDGAATNPEATIAALKYLIKEDYKLILILGGKTKFNNYQYLNQFIVSNLANFSLIFASGEVREVLSIPGSKLSEEISMRSLFDNLPAVLDKKITEDTHQKLALLFSPAGASFDEFSSYLQRADYFVKTILSQSSKLNS